MWVTVGVGNFGVVVAGSGVVPKPRNKLLVSQGFLIVAPRFYAALHYINLFVLYTFMSCCLCSLRGGWPRVFLYHAIFGRIPLFYFSVRGG